MSEPRIYSNIRAAIKAEDPNSEIGKTIHFITRGRLNEYGLWDGTEYILTKTAEREISEAEYERGRLREMREQLTRRRQMYDDTG